MTPIECRTISSQAVLMIRHPVLRPGQPLSAAKFPEDAHASTFHVGAFVGGRLVGVASILDRLHADLELRQQAQLRGMATLAEVRGQGVGRQILHFAEARLRGQEVAVVWCNARRIAFDFYLKAGFQFGGEVFQIEGIGSHRMMFKTL